MSVGRHTAVLRGIAHARLYASAGDGLETIFSKLAGGNCGWVSGRFAKLLKAVHEGKTSQEVLREELGRAEKRSSRGYALLLAALLCEGDGVDKRLASATEDVIEEANNQATRNTARARFFSKIVAIAMVMSFAPIIYGFIAERVGQHVPDFPNPSPAYTLTLSAFIIAASGFLMVGRD